MVRVQDFRTTAEPILLTRTDWLRLVGYLGLVDDWLRSGQRVKAERLKRGIAHAITNIPDRA